MVITLEDLLVTWLKIVRGREGSVHHTRVAKDHLIVSIWFLQGPRRSDILARVL
jgi:hypothetical protein